MGVEKWGQDVRGDKDIFLKLADHLYTLGLIKLSKELICSLLLYILKTSLKGKNCESLFLFPKVCLNMSKETQLSTLRPVLFWSLLKPTHTLEQKTKEMLFYKIKRFKLIMSVKYN